jgi:hypothetical protein
MAIDVNRFKKVVSLVIDNLEGGYYHPNMLADGRVKDQRYANSGETMFGIDRLRGGSINTSAAGQQFWNIIDSINAKNTWKWNYKGGELAAKLKLLVGEMMLPLYNSLSKSYLTPEAQKLVESDDRLIFNFAYAAWNGPGWFKKFATDMNKAVGEGIKNPDELVKVAIKSRTAEGLKPGSAPNSLIAQGGAKIEKLMSQLKGVITESTKQAMNYAKDNPIPIIITSVVLGTTLFFLI